MISFSAFGRPTALPELPLKQILVAVSLAAALTILAGVGSVGGAAVVGYAALAMAMLSPATGLAVLILLVPLRQPAGFGPLGFDLVLGLSILLGCLGGLTRGRSEIRVTPLWAALGAFGILAGIQVMATPMDFLGEQSAYAVLQLAAIAGGGTILLSAQYLLRGRDWGSYLDLIVLAGVVVAGLAIASIATKGTIRGTFPGLFGIGIEQDRAVGPFNNSNYFGLFAVLTLIVALHRASSGPPWRRIVTLLATAVIAIAVVLSFSRGALLAGAAGLIVLGFSRRPMLGVAAILLCVIGAFASYQMFSEARFGATAANISTDAALANQAASDAGRLAATNAGFVLFGRNPIFGVGFGQYHFVSTLYLDGNPTSYSHNWYMDVLAEQGIVGISLMALAAVLIMIGLCRAEPSRRGLACAVLAAYAVGSAFTEAPGSPQTSGIAWFVVGGALASVTSASFEARRPPAGFTNALRLSFGRRT